MDCKKRQWMSQMNKFNAGVVTTVCIQALLIVWTGEYSSKLFRYDSQQTNLFNKILLSVVLIGIIINQIGHAFKQ